MASLRSGGGGANNSRRAQLSTFPNHSPVVLLEGLRSGGHQQPRPVLHRFAGPFSTPPPPAPRPHCSFLNPSPSQLVSSQPPATLLVSSIGIFSSYLYRTDFLSLRSYRLSPRLTLLFVRFFSPLLGTTPAPRRSASAAFGHIEPGGGGGIGFPTASFGVARAPAPVATTTGATTPGETTVAQRRAQGQAIVQQLTTSFTGNLRRPPTEE